MRFHVALALVVGGVTLSTLAPAHMAAPVTVQSAADLKHYDVMIRRFDPAQGMSSGQEFVLPVDSPDEDDAIANAASSPGKAANGRTLPVAFTAVRVVRR